jgi:hypothetical protein
VAVMLGNLNSQEVADHGHEKGQIQVNRQWFADRLLCKRMSHRQRGTEEGGANRAELEAGGILVQSA